MKTRMTKAQLREAIAEKRGWACKYCGKGAPHPGCANALGVGDLMPDYPGSMNDAMPLLRELPDSKLVLFKTLCAVMWRPNPEPRSPYERVESPSNKEAEAIACAWWQWKTGEVVELVSE